ncbi:transglutaminase-like domain-containing protein [Methanoculleus caldifontis]|uniref:transglutaminase-like domain-containing protein n=1 Tax=Methanoculleus caldifontis TaxID=2651577 RepID=UPI002936E011|nr:transglutaminase-like domain-containing protein [Methanoculleus sp. Wushi-C6]
MFIPQGHLIYDGGSGFGAAEEVSAERIAALSRYPDPLPDPSPDALIDRVDRTTFSCVDGTPRLFPVGIDATLAHGVGDCTDLALLRVEVLRRNGIPAKPVHGLMIWNAGTFKTNALHVEILGKGVAVHDWVELGDGRTMGAYEGVPGVRCVKTGNGVCLQPVFKTLGYL